MHALSVEKKIVICFDSCKFLLLTYLLQKKTKKTHPIHYFKPLSVSSVYPDKNHWTVVKLRLDLPAGPSLVPSNCSVFTQSQLLQPRSQIIFTVVNSKDDLGTRLKQSPMNNFLLVPVSCTLYWQSWNGPATTKTKTCKELSQNEACSLDIGTQYWTDLHGIALNTTN